MFHVVNAVVSGGPIPASLGGLAALGGVWDSIKTNSVASGVAVARPLCLSSPFVFFVLKLVVVLSVNFRMAILGTSTHALSGAMLTYRYVGAELFPNIWWVLCLPLNKMSAGPLPTALGGLTALKRLGLEGNQLTVSGAVASSSLTTYRVSTDYLEDTV